MAVLPRTFFLITILLAVVIGGCSGAAGGGKHRDLRGASEGQEESGTELSLDESYDRVRNGARLTLAYDEESNSFVGSVENTT